MRDKSRYKKRKNHAFSTTCLRFDERVEDRLRLRRNAVTDFRRFAFDAIERLLLTLVDLVGIQRR
jgi:hypothetical protein